MNPAVRSRFGTALLVLGLAAVPGCGRTSPAGPTPAAASDSQPGVPGTGSGTATMTRRGTGAVAFPILSGTFTIANDSGDSLTGTYTGTSFVSPGSPERAALNLRISGGTGAFAGATGVLGAAGAGVFTGDGAFTLDVKGDAILQPKHVPLRIALTGNSAVSCSEQSIVVSQTATGSMKKTGDVHATFSHVVGQAGCDS